MQDARHPIRDCIGEIGALPPAEETTGSATGEETNG